MSWHANLADWAMQRLGALVGHGASIRTPEFEIRAATSEGVVRLLREVRMVSPVLPAERERSGGSMHAVSTETLAGSVSKLSPTANDQREQNAL